MAKLTNPSVKGRIIESGTVKLGSHKQPPTLSSRNLI